MKPTCRNPARLPRTAFRVLPLGANLLSLIYSGECSHIPVTGLFVPNRGEGMEVEQQISYPVGFDNLPSSFMSVKPEEVRSSNAEADRTNIRS
jgi:hypothetical protein